MTPHLRGLGVISALLMAPIGLRAQQADTLPDLVVTGSRAPEPLSELAASATVIKRDALTAKQAWTVDRALQDVPGVSLTGDATFGQEVRLAIRGLTSGYGTQRALIMLDGRPLTDEYLGHVDLAQFPLLAMDRIEVVRGPTSAAYGSSALGGVINMIPLRGGEHPRTELLVQGGSFGSVGPSVSHSRASGRFDMAANASFHRTNGYLDNSAGNNMDWQRQNGLLNLGYTGSRVSLRSYSFYSHGDGTDQDFDRKVTRWSQDLSIIAMPGSSGRFVSKAQLYYTNLLEHLGWFDRPGSEYRHHTVGAILTQQAQIGRSNSLMIVADLRSATATTEEATGNVDRTDNTWAIFAQDRIRLGDRATVLLGVRGDQPDGGDMTWSGRGGINYRLTEGTTAIAAAGKAFRSPTLSDRYLPTTSAFGLVFEGNPELESETVTSFELGLRQQVGTFQFGVTGFSSRAEGFWDFLPQEDGVFRPTNIAEVEIRGVELSASMALATGLRAEAGYTYSDATYDKFEGNESAIGNRLDDNVRHVVTGALGYTWRQGHSIRAEARRFGDRVTDPNDQAGTRLDPWTTVDISGAVRITPALEVSATLRNALDEHYRTRPEFRQAGRAVYGAIRVVW